MALQGFIEQVAAQTAVYWGSPVADGEGGMDWGDPVELKVRWDNVTKLIKDAKGREVACRAEVLVAGRLEDDGSVTPVDLEVDGRLYLGTLDDLDSDQAADPMQLEAAWVIVRSDKNPEFGSDSEFVRVVYL